MSLYRKYRPTEFEDMIGNEAEIESFQKSLEKKKDRPHVYLITGPSGCGKTTLARIAAQKLGADELTTSEINTADNRGIDTARDIISQTAYLTGTARVFIIDEVHQTSKDWQNAMLKPLEDTPEHVYFFLCTTDPKKLIPALKSRCSTVKVESLDEDSLYRLLRRVCKKEGIEKSKEIIQDIAENCSGSPRAGLVLLEKISDIDDEKTMREIISMGEKAEKEVIELCRVLLKDGTGWKGVGAILKGLKDVDPEKIRFAVLGYMNAVLLNSGSHRAGVAIECFSEPFWNSGKAELTLACYQVVKGE